MNTSLLKAESVYVPQRRRKAKKKKQPKPSPQLSKTIIHTLPQAKPQAIPRPSSKSVEPHKLPLVRVSSPNQMSPGSQHGISSVDISMERLERLQYKNTSARNELMAVQERILALGMRNRCLLDLSVDEARDLFVDNRYEVLLHKYKDSSKSPLRLPPIRRPAD